MNTTIFDPFLRYIYTTSDAETVDSIVTTVMNDFYQVKHQDSVQTILQNLPPRLGDQLQAVLQQNNIAKGSQEDLKSFLERLLEALHSTKTIVMTVAEPLTYNMTETLGKTVKDSYGAETILEVSIDPHIIAGAIVTHEGRYIDNSLRSKVEKQFLNAS